MSETPEITRAEAKARDRYHPMRSTPKACVRGFVCARVSFNARCLACKRGDSPVQVRHHPPPRQGRTVDHTIER
jgi:hypothetical protein